MEQVSRNSCCTNSYNMRMLREAGSSLILVEGGVYTSPGFNLSLLLLHSRACVLLAAAAALYLRLGGGGVFIMFFIKC